MTPPEVDSQPYSLSLQSTRIDAIASEPMQSSGIALQWLEFELQGLGFDPHALRSKMQAEILRMHLASATLSERGPRCSIERSHDLVLPPSRSCRVHGRRD